MAVKMILCFRYIVCIGLHYVTLWQIHNLYLLLFTMILRSFYLQNVFIYKVTMVQLHVALYHSL